jgi:uncharacterized protein
MRRPLLSILVWMAIGCGWQAAGAQTLEFAIPAAASNEELAGAIPPLASRTIAAYTEPDADKRLDTLLRLQIGAGKYSDAKATLGSLQALRPALQTGTADLRTTAYELYVSAKLAEAGGSRAFADAYSEALRAELKTLNDRGAYDLGFRLQTHPNAFQNGLRGTRAAFKDKTSLTPDEAVRIVRSYVDWRIANETFALSDTVLQADSADRYIIKDDVLIKTPDGAMLSAIVVRPARTREPLPTALNFYIQTSLPFARDKAILAAAHGYVGVVADARGKRLSPNPPEYTQHEPQDAYAVIDWVSRQPWSNGKVGMYGGSYSGLAQWAAVKNVHPALKTIVPYCANNAGYGLPMFNNVFITANYAYAFYAVSNKTLDDGVYADSNRWDRMLSNWYSGGRPFRELDQVDGRPNPDLQRWLKHPAYDAYWQSLAPYKGEYARIKIPVLSIDGYYDDGQTSALRHRAQHLEYNPTAEHYLVIGPYDHFGTQAARKPMELRGYLVDPVAQFDTVELTYQWFDYVLRGASKPAMLRDKVNYQVMGANVWKHAPTIEKMGNEVLTLYLTEAQQPEPKPDAFHVMSARKPAAAGSLEQVVDFADRKTVNNVRYYPAPIVGRNLDGATGLRYLSAPFETVVEVNGIPDGVLHATLNKKDLDYGLTLYEVMPDGRLFHLGYTLGRASYAKDETRRQLLEPGKAESIPFRGMPLISRQLSKGSRLLVVLDVNKNSLAQINYGTGKDVSDESIADAKEPLRVQWHNDSYIRVPIWR